MLPSPLYPSRPTKGISRPCPISLLRHLLMGKIKDRPQKMVEGPFWNERGLFHIWIGIYRLSGILKIKKNAMRISVENKVYLYFETNPLFLQRPYWRGFL
jgi:hypothetical protein